MLAVTQANYCLINVTKAESLNTVTLTLSMLTVKQIKSMLSV